VAKVNKLSSLGKNHISALPQASFHCNLCIVKYHRIHSLQTLAFKKKRKKKE